MTKLEKTKEIIKEHFKDADCGIFNNHNWCGDPMITIYNKNDLIIDICYEWNYFEIFGLSDEEFKELKKFYSTLEKEENN